MASKRLGEIKGPLIVWLFVTSYFAILIVFGGSSKGTLPQEITMLLVLNLITGMAESYGVIVVFLIIFLVFWEKQRSLRGIFSGVGLRRKGSIKSVFWSLAITPFFLLVIGLIGMLLSYFLGPVSFPQASGSSGGQVPLWYLYYMIIYSFFPVAVVEETWARGYMLDRLMPQHPSSLVKALPAILLSSLLFTFYHLPSYLRLYSLSAPWVVALLAGNVFPWSVGLSIAYVRARTRNIMGPVLIHFLADSIPIILSLA